jgi:dipeptidase E
VSSAPRQIVAVGGGGFLMDDTSGTQERFLLSLARTQSAPRVLYLPTANGDGERGQLKFFRLFSDLAARCSVLPFYMYEMKRDYVRAAREADLIYVGGGNTPAMLAVWREFDFQHALRAAYDRAGRHQRRRQLLVRALHHRQRTRRRCAPRPRLAARHVLPAPGQ